MSSRSSHSYAMRKSKIMLHCDIGSAFEFQHGYQKPFNSNGTSLFSSAVLSNFMQIASGSSIVFCQKHHESPFFEEKLNHWIHLNRTTSAVSIDMPADIKANARIIIEIPLTSETKANQINIQKLHLGRR